MRTLAEAQQGWWCNAAGGSCPATHQPPLSGLPPSDLKTGWRGAADWRAGARYRARRDVQAFSMQDCSCSTHPTSSYPTLCRIPGSQQSLPMAHITSCLVSALVVATLLVASSSAAPTLKIRCEFGRVGTPGVQP